MLSDENDVSIDDITEDTVTTTPPPRSRGRKKKEEPVEPAAQADEAPVKAEAPTPSSGSSVVDEVASMSDDEKQALLDALGVSEAVRVATSDQPARREVPLAIRVGVWPVDGEATKKMNATKAAEIMGVSVENIMAYAIRAPRNVDGEPISEQAHLIVTLGDSSKKAVPYTG